MTDPATDPATPPATVPLDAFVALSAILTGIAKDKLHPFLDTHGTAEAYLIYALEHAPLAFGKLMALYVQNQDQPDATVAELIMAASDPDISYIAKTVMLMWYLGAWYEPAGLAAYTKTCLALKPTDPAPFPPPSVVISSDAYTQGWAWQVGQAHPMGYSDFRFGYWNGAPVPLDDLVGA
jgi:hypothetical protein